MLPKVRKSAQGAQNAKKSPKGAQCNRERPNQFDRFFSNVTSSINLT